MGLSLEAFVMRNTCLEITYAIDFWQSPPMRYEQLSFRCCKGRSFKPWPKAWRKSRLAQFLSRVLFVLCFLSWTYGFLFFFFFLQLYIIESVG